MLGYILKSESELIAVVSSPKDTSIHKSIKLAISEHYCCDNVDDVTFLTKFDSEFDIQTVEDGEECVRTFTIQLVAIY